MIGWLAAALGGYLLGSVSFAVLVSRIMGLADPRTFGSGNPGATNVLRTGNRLAAVLTLLGDALKGTLAVWLVLQFGAASGLGPAHAALAGAAAFVGHLWPVYTGFVGGKGVATFLGVGAALAPWASVAACAVWLAVAAATRYSSVASLSAAIALPLVAAVRGDGLPVVAALLLMAALLVLRHRGNLANLRAGRERKIGARAAPPESGL